MQDVIVAFGSPGDAKKIRSILQRNGFNVVCETTSGARVLTACEDLTDGVVVCGYRLGDMRYLELAQDLPRYFQMLLVTAPSRVDEDVLPANVCFLPMPLKVGKLVETLGGLLGRMRKLRKQERSKKKTHTQKEQETINAAKAILMERHGMTEPQAHRYLQKCAMDSGTGIVEMAEMVMTLAEM